MNEKRRYIIQSPTNRIEVILCESSPERQKELFEKIEKGWRLVGVDIPSGWTDLSGREIYENDILIGIDGSIHFAFAPDREDHNETPLLGDTGGKVISFLGAKQKIEEKIGTNQGRDSGVFPGWIDEKRYHPEGWGIFCVGDIVEVEITQEKTGDKKIVQGLIDAPIRALAGCRAMSEMPGGDEYWKNIHLYDAARFPQAYYWIEEYSFVVEDSGADLIREGYTFSLDRIRRAVTPKQNSINGATEALPRKRELHTAIA